MGRTLRIVAGLAGVLAALWAIGSVDWRPAREPRVAGLGAPLHLAGPVLSGAAEVDVTPPEPVSLGGFGSRRGAAFTAVRDPVAARAVVLGRPPEALALVSLDVVLIPEPLARAIRERVAERLGLREVVVTATHTHNGPGGYWDNPVAAVAGLGAFDASVRERLVEGAAAAVAGAVDALRETQLTVATGDGPPLCRSRVKGRAPDRRLTVVTARPAHESGGQGPAAGPAERPDPATPTWRLVVFPCHPTVLGARDRRLSAEWPGEAARRLDGVTMVLQGAVGDVTAGRLPGDTRDLRVEALAAAVATRVRALESEGRPADSVAFSAAELALPAPTGETLAPAGLRNLAGNVLSWLAPGRARVSALRIGEAALVLVPGETVTPLAARWEAALGPPDAVRVVSLADGYAGYLETPSALAERGGESRQAYYGAELGALMEQAAAARLEAIRLRDRPQRTGAQSSQRTTSPTSTVPPSSTTP